MEEEALVPEEMGEHRPRSPSSSNFRSRFSKIKPFSYTSVIATLLVIVLFINLIAFTFQGGLREPLPIDGDLNPDTSIPPHQDTSNPGPLIPGTHQNASDRDY